MEDPQTYDGRPSRPPDAAWFLGLLYRWLAHLDLDASTPVSELRRRIERTVPGGRA